MRAHHHGITVGLEGGHDRVVSGSGSVLRGGLVLEAVRVVVSATEEENVRSESSKRRNHPRSAPFDPLFEMTSFF